MSNGALDTEMNNQSNYDGPIQIDDDSDYNNELYSNNDGMDEISANQYITRKQDYHSNGNI